MRIALLVVTIPLGFFSGAAATETHSAVTEKQLTSPDGALDDHILTTANPWGTVTIQRSARTQSSTTRIGDVSIRSETRHLPGDASAVSDDLGGWRLERRTNAGTLSSIRDTHGMVVDIVRAAGGRPVGVLLGEDLVLEYVYSPGAGPWMRKVIYDLNTGELLADVTNDGQSVGEWVQPAHLPDSTASGPVAERFDAYGGGWHLVSVVDDRRYALLPLEDEGRVIRSVAIDGPPSSSVGDRVDYTDSEIVVHLATGAGKASLVVAAPRSTRDERDPIVIEDDEPAITSYLAVLSVGNPPEAPISAEPTVNGTFASSVTEKLNESFALAIDKVRRNPKCLELFEPFLVSGVDRLESTFYAPPNPERTYDSCDRGALAYTHVGSPVTHLCSEFETVSREEAAVVLIHEALHFAGLSEAPSSPGALTSNQISQMVIGACGF